MSQHSSRGADWERRRQRILKRDQYLCQHCRVAQATTVDHIIPKASGGTDDDANLLASCAPCNQRKGAKTLTRQTWVNPRWAVA